MIFKFTQKYEGVCFFLVKVGILKQNGAIFFLLIETDLNKIKYVHILCYSKIHSVPQFWLCLFVFLLLFWKFIFLIYLSIIWFCLASQYVWVYFLRVAVQ